MTDEKLIWRYGCVAAWHGSDQNCRGPTNFGFGNIFLERIASKIGEGQ